MTKDRCPGTGMRTLRFRINEPDRCPVCARIAYVCVDGTTGSHRAPASLRKAAQKLSEVPF